MIMRYEQVKFRITNSAVTDIDNDVYYGIAAYDYKDYLYHIVCGCCGGIFEPQDVEILESYPWIDLEDTIKGDD